MGLSREEQETYIYLSPAEKEASIYSCDPVWIKKLEKLAAKRPEEFRLVKETEDSVEYVCPKKWIKITLPPNMSEEQRAAAAERIKAYHQRKNNADS